VVSEEALLEHHARRAQLWERQALVKARAVAGDVAYGERLLGTALAPLVWERPLPEGAAEEIHRLRMRMEREVAGESVDQLNPKTGQGGLVDVEFVCLDLVRDKVLYAGTYDLWVDIKVLHCLWDDPDRQSYLSQAIEALKPGGLLFLNEALAMADVRDHFPAVFDALDANMKAWAARLDRDLPEDQRTGIRCETLDWYCRELEHAGFELCQATREASMETGWGAIIVARKPASVDGKC
jgi:SAM-dependent methyltransferase